MGVEAGGCPWQRFPMDSPAPLLLVVDDDPLIRDMAAQALTRGGYRVLTAGDGTEAVALFAQEQAAIEMVITDMKMPKMDGNTLAQVLRHVQPDLRLLAMSGQTAGPHAPQTDRFGDAIIYKPFKVQALVQEVRRVLGGEPVAVTP
jgi:two-component system, cell cycle sensor histidine kinase and response regulator CckA